MNKQIILLCAALITGNSFAMLTTFAKQSARILPCLQLQGTHAYLTDKAVERQTWEISVLWPLKSKLVSFEEEKILLESSLKSLESLHKGVFVDRHVVNGPLVNPEGSEHRVVHTFCLHSNLALQTQNDDATFETLRKFHLEAIRDQNKAIAQTLAKIKMMKAIIEAVKDEEQNAPRVQS